MKFRKRPVVIDAIQWDGELATITDLYALGLDPIRISEARLNIETLEGEMTAMLGDWVIKGVQGEFYPCKPDIFAATYEAVATREPSA